MVKAEVFGGHVLLFKNEALFVFFVSSLFVVTEGWCTGCEANQTCCGQVCINRSTWEWNCPEGKTCCSNVCVSGSSCLGENCSFPLGCKLDESCCSGKCKPGNDCIGEPCWTKDDCRPPEYCCGDTCSSVDCSVASGIVFGSVFGTPLVILVIVLSVFLTCRRYRRADGTGFEGQREATETTGIVTKSIFLGLSLPLYQEEDPYYPPPEYMEYPLCSVECCQPPPVYSSHGGEPTTRNSYGAV